VSDRKVRLSNDLYNFVSHLGFEIVAVALDIGGAAAARPWIEAAKAEYPTLIDQAHVLDELLGIVNVPSGAWINEEGMLVRPPEPAFPSRPTYLNVDLSDPKAAARYQALSTYRRAVIAEAGKIRIQPERYIGALRDWRWRQRR